MEISMRSRACNSFSSSTAVAATGQSPAEKPSDHTAISEKAQKAEGSLTTFGMPPNRDRNNAVTKDEERVILASPRNADRRPRRCRTSSQTRKRRYFSVERERVPSDWDGAPQCGGGERGPGQLIGIVAEIIHQKVNVNACRGAPYGLE